MVQAIKFMRPAHVAAGVVMGYKSTNASIPAGHSRVTAADGQFIRQIATSATNPSLTPAGNANHDHPFTAHGASSQHLYDAHNHSGSWGNSPSESSGANCHGAAGSNNSQVSVAHTHTSFSDVAAAITVSNNSSPSNTGTQTNNPNHVTHIIIQSNGMPTTIPMNAVVWYNGSAPSGYSVYSAMDNRFMKGAAGGADGGASLGSSVHTHTTTHAHPVGGTHLHVLNLNNDTNGGALNTAGGFGADPYPHGHSTLGNSTAASNPTNSDNADAVSGNGTGDPSWQKLRAITPTSGPVPLRAGIICMWFGTIANIPNRWRLCDGGGGTPNACQGFFVRGASTDGEVGNTGGGTQHTHSTGTAHGHGSSNTTHGSAHNVSGLNSSAAAGGDDALNDGTDGGVAAAFHAHNSGTYNAPTTVDIGTSTTHAPTEVISTANAHDPSYVTAAYIQFMG